MLHEDGTGKTIKFAAKSERRFDPRILNHLVQQRIYQIFKYVEVEIDFVRKLDFGPNTCAFC